jgi:DNA-binding MltR family transcriptional regulator
MQSLENPVEEATFYNHDSNRAVGVMWPAIVENRLTDVLKACMRRDEAVAKELFRPEGALGTFGQKIKLGYMLGLYEKDLKDDSVLLTKIRNKFAHSVEVADFETLPIRHYMDQMTTLKVHRSLLESMKKENPTEGTRRTALFVLTNELMDYRNSFHLCIRSIIHKLVAIERALKARTTNPPTQDPERQS